MTCSTTTSTTTTTIQLRPIGYVRNAFRVSEHHERSWFEALVSEIEILPEYAAGLAGVERLASVVVLFHFDRCSQQTALLAHPRGDTGRPLRGMFTMGCPSRPNHIGMCTCPIVAVRGPTTLVVRCLEALDGTPILDLHPGEKKPHRHHHHII
jgi:L-fuculose-phosphate aldolase